MPGKRNISRHFVYLQGAGVASCPMPELPEVETIGRGLHTQLVDRVVSDVVVRRRDLRVPIPADFRERVIGRRVLGVQRRAKYLLWPLDDGGLIVAHLGMTGRFTVRVLPIEDVGPHDHVLLYTNDGRCTTFSDPRRFGVLVLGHVKQPSLHPLLKGLGPEPLDDAWDAPQLLAKVQGRKSPLKSLLLDQSVIAGLGNIYVSEALFRARISPLRLGCSLMLSEARRLVPAIRQVLRDAIDAGGSTLRDYVQADGAIGGFQNQFSVYEQHDQPCPHRGCKGRIQRIVQAGRSTYFCPSCQK